MGKANASSRTVSDLKQLMTPSYAGERKENRQFMSSLARGLDVLGCFKPFDGPLSNQEIASRTKLPKPTVSRITYTLTRLGYLEYVETLERYRLGTAVLALGYAFRGGLEIRKLAKPHLDEFVAETGATIALCAPYRMSFIILDIASNKESMRLMLDSGSRIDVVGTPATGVYLEAIPKADQQMIIDLAEETEPEKWRAMRKEVTRCRKEVRETGFCVFESAIAVNVNVCATMIVPPQADKLFMLEAYAHNYEVDRETFYNKVGPALVHTSEMIRIEAANWGL